jgi:tRNA-splicing ligase RtcB
MKVLAGARVPIKVFVTNALGAQIVPIEDQAEQQLFNLAKMPFVHSHIAAMPDVHWGMGATVGSVIATVGAIIPAAVGVDIGCGMMAVKTDATASDLPNNLAAMRADIERAIPVGGPGEKGSWKEAGRHGAPTAVAAVWRGMAEKYKAIGDKHPKIARGLTVEQLGTLGTGNHFMEVCLDEHQGVWVMLHSGSRGLGNRIGTYFIEKAKEEAERWFIHLPDKDLAYLTEGSEHFADYVTAVGFAQNFALANRQLMMDRIISVLHKHLPPFSIGGTAVNCHHNYVQKEHHFGKDVWLTRKGAVKAKTGTLGIIPGSMGAKSYIVRGKGNRDSFESCSHGAGRAMSRTAAKKTFTLADHAKATEGVECRKDDGVLDETPGAYKSIDAVMEAQKDLVEIVFTLKQVLCVKG